MAKKVCVIIASESDKDIGDKVIEVLGKFNVPYQYEQASAHREPKRVEQIVQASDADIFICVAGLAGALPGFVAALTNKPVIGVPKNAKLMGLDALLSMAQMPSGIPVATVGVDNGKNAAYLAIRILGLQYPEVYAGEPSSSHSASGKAVLQNFQFEPPVSSPSSASAPMPSTPNSFAAFPLFAQEPSSAQQQSYATPATSPTIPATVQSPARQPAQQAGRVFGDWGVPTPKPKEKPKGDWFKY